MRKAKIKLTEDELNYLINDINVYIWKIKDTDLTKKRYYIRQNLLKKLLAIKQKYFKNKKGRCTNEQA